MAIKTPKFLQEFILGGGTGGINNVIVTASKTMELSGQISRKIKQLKQLKKAGQNISTVYEIISLLRVVIIPIGVTFRVIYCLVKMIYDEESVGSYKKKIKNTIIFGIIAELTFVINDLIIWYYK